MPSIDAQFPDFGDHHAAYPEIDPAGAMAGSAAGKVIFITGASRGIGQATAAAFAKAGASAIYIVARSKDALEETKRRIAEANAETRCASMACDVRSAEQVEEAVADCARRFGGIDAADANAGYLDRWAKIGQSDPESWWRSWEVNMRGAYHVTRYCVPHLIESAQVHSRKGSSGGHLILISSVGAQLLMPTASDYQTAKHAINRLCEFVKADHGDEGVKCFAVHPGGVPTSLAKNMPSAMHQYLVDAPELAAGFIVWLCSGRADWASGRYLSANWDVDELLRMKVRIVGDDLLVNRLRA